QQNTLHQHLHDAHQISHKDIPNTESSLKNLHNIILKYSKKDEWHKGDYKQHSNAVEAKFPDGTHQIVFQTTEAGLPTQDAMRLLDRKSTRLNSSHVKIS